MEYRRVDVFQKPRPVCYGFVAAADYGLAIIIKFKFSSSKRVFRVRCDVCRQVHHVGFRVPYRFFDIVFKQSLFKTKFVHHCRANILLRYFLRMSLYDSTTKSIKAFVSNNISDQHFDNSITSFFSNVFLPTFNFVCKESNIFSKFKIS